MLNERFYVVRVIVLLLALLGVMTNVRADYVDLSDGGVEISPWVRCDEDRPQACVIVKKGDDTYLVVHDQKGELKIFKITEGKLVLIWGRETI